MWHCTRYEKMISGKYVGELARLAMQSLIKANANPLFGGKSSAKFDKFLEFDTKFVSMIEAGYVKYYYLLACVCYIACEE